MGTGGEAAGAGTGAGGETTGTGLCRGSGGRFGAYRGGGKTVAFFSFRK